MRKVRLSFLGEPSSPTHPNITLAWPPPLCWLPWLHPQWVPYVSLSHRCSNLESSAFLLLESSPQLLPTANSIPFQSHYSNTFSMRLTQTLDLKVKPTLAWHCLSPISCPASLEFHWSISNILHSFLVMIISYFPLLEYKPHKGKDFCQVFFFLIVVCLAQNLYLVHPREGWW